MEEGVEGDMIPLARAIHTCMLSFISLAAQLGTSNWKIKCTQPKKHIISEEHSFTINIAVHVACMVKTID